jgi:hypothetical protein
MGIRGDRGQDEGDPGGGHKEEIGDEQEESPGGIMQWGMTGNG